MAAIVTRTAPMLSAGRVMLSAGRVMLSAGRMMLVPTSVTFLVGSLALLAGSLVFLGGCSHSTLGPCPSLPDPTSSSRTFGGAADVTAATAIEDMPGLAKYADRRNRFVIYYPVWWQETNLRQLGDADVYGIEVVGFADHQGPVVDGCYSNMLQVNILEDIPYDESILSRLPDTLPETLERLRAKNDAVQVLEPWKKTQIAGAPAMAMRLTLSDDGHTFSGLDCVLVAEQRLYELEFFTIEADWERYEPLFHRILSHFEVGGD